MRYSASKRWVAVDIKNAYHSTNWGHLINSLTNIGLTTYLTNSIKNYLKDRNVVVTKWRVIRTSAGVPRGSLLGPNLWNILYNEFLNIKYRYGTECIAFADGLLVRFEADVSGKQSGGNNWNMAKKARPYTSIESIVLGRPRQRLIKFRVEKTTVTLSYLGELILDSRL